MKRLRMTGAVAAVVALLLAISGCSAKDDEPGATADPNDPNVLRILAGSEVKDMAPILDRAAEATGVRVEFTYSGTLEGAETIASGAADGAYDAVWFSSNRYLSLIPDASKRVTTPTKIMMSPVVLGLRESKMRELGWDTQAPSWAEIADAAGKKQFTYGMTNPSSSNSGFSALVGVATALAGGGAALDQSRADKVAPELKKFFAGQAMTSGSSGWLAERYVEAARQGTPVDGIINYESVILQLNEQAQAGEKLVPVYPSDGVITADYPLTLMTSAAPGKKESFAKLTDWLRTKEAQGQIMRDVDRRPVVAVAPDRQRYPDVIELPFPNQRAVADSLISSYLNGIAKPSRTFYVLDVSGSMADEGRIDALKSSLQQLAGTGASDGAGAFSRFRLRESVTFLPFNSIVEPPREFVVPEKEPDAVLREIADAASRLEPGGGTAIYDALRDAYGRVGLDPQAGSETFTSIVLMTDGEWTEGSGPSEFESWYRTQPAEVRAVPTFTIIYGNSAPKELKRIAEVTGGKVFDARSSDLAAVFREIRGYQ